MQMKGRTTLMSQDPEPKEYVLLNEEAKGTTVVVCDHARNRIPVAYERLGLDELDLRRAIAWDIGAAGVAEMLACRLDAQAILSNVSRLVIDCNRPLSVRDSIPIYSEDTDIPGNRCITENERNLRAEKYFWPYHRCIKRCLEYRAEQGYDTSLVSIHSFTPMYAGIFRPWHIGFTYGVDDRLAKELIQYFTQTTDLTVGDNEPYPIDYEGDYTIIEHGEKRGYPNVLIEIRNDLIAYTDNARSWAERLASALTEVGLPKT